MKSRKKTRRQGAYQLRRGAITVLACLMSTVVLGMVAFAVDYGYLLSSKQELQRTADSAALAACWDYGQKMSQGYTAANAINLGRTAAAGYAGLNVVGKVHPAIDQNVSNSGSGDLVFGYISDLYDPNCSLNTTPTADFNAVRVKIRRDSTLNGETPFFFGKIFGRTGQGLSAEATAGYIRHVKGFRTPSSGGNLGILPFSLDRETWNALLVGQATDEWTWNPQTHTVTPGPDGVLEVNLYPQGTGSPGNRGTVDIGGSNNSTADIARQIVYGISPSDMADLGKPLEFDHNGNLDLNGDTGISAGVKDELASIKGQPRMIPIFAKVVGPGNNADYTIVHWAGIRIMDVKLTGAMSQKHVIVQPAPMVVSGVVASTEETSDYIYSPVALVR